MKEVPCDTCEFLNDTSLHPPCLICNEENNWECYEKYDPNKKDVVGDSIKDLNKNAPQPCPWCGDTDIKFSSKTMSDGRGFYGDREYSRRKVAMYCNKCKTYGPRAIVEGTSYNGADEEGKDVALTNWNTRYTPDNSIEGMIKRLDERNK